jgi:hypothetical protein
MEGLLSMTMAISPVRIATGLIEAWGGDTLSTGLINTINN